jgi:hypothetical protein
MYVTSNPRTKKALREQLEAAQADGKPGLPCFQPGPFGPGVRDGVEVAEGPHYPEPHRWYAQVTIRNIDGQPYVVAVKK